MEEYCKVKFSIIIIIIIYTIIPFQYQGDEKLDTDIPTYFEAKLFCTTFGKFCWVLLQPLFYAFRPVFMYAKSPTLLEIINVVIQLSFNALIVYLCGRYLNKLYVYYIFSAVLLML